LRNRPADQAPPRTGGSHNRLKRDILRTPFPHKLDAPEA
jgi:hypothetical protein